MTLPEKTVIVLGAGAIGVCSALMLQQRGYTVTLIDRKVPASETSAGNAGIIGASAAVPLNNPTLWRELIALLSSDSAALSLNWQYVATQLPWLVRFFAHTAMASTKQRTQALFQLIVRSQTLHQLWAQNCGIREQVRESGWLKCYRSEKSFARAATEHALWRELGLDYDVLDSKQLTDKAPYLQPVFTSGIYMHDTLSAVDPKVLVRAYADWFIADGGIFIQAEIKSLEFNKSGWSVSLDNGETHSAKTAVVSLGPWSKNFLKPLNINLPMAYERGSHRNFTVTSDTLNIPLSDVDGGYMAVMQKDTLRVTTGVYFADLTAHHSTAQLDTAENYLRKSITGIGHAVGDDWFGTRPTMADSLPLIGPTKHPDLWLATAHQHIGLTTAPSTGELIADWISGNEPPHKNFSPARFDI